MSSLILLAAASAFMPVAGSIGLPLAAVAVDMTVDQLHCHNAVAQLGGRNCYHTDFIRAGGIVLHDLEGQDVLFFALHLIEDLRLIVPGEVDQLSVILGGDGSAVAGNIHTVVGNRTVGLLVIIGQQVNARIDLDGNAGGISNNGGSIQRIGLGGANRLAGQSVTEVITHAVDLSGQVDNIAVLRCFDTGCGDVSHHGIAADITLTALDTGLILGGLFQRGPLRDLMGRLILLAAASTFMPVAGRILAPAVLVIMDMSQLQLYSHNTLAQLAFRHSDHAKLFGGVIAQLLDGQNIVHNCAIDDFLLIQALILSIPQEGGAVISQGLRTAGIHPAVLTLIVDIEIPNCTIRIFVLYGIGVYAVNLSTDDGDIGAIGNLICHRQAVGTECTGAGCGVQEIVILATKVGGQIVDSFLQKHGD